MQLHKIWIEQCEAARGIENEFGVVPAIKYLVGEKFINYLDAAERDAEFRVELPAFVAEIRKIFEPWQLKEYLDKAGWTEPFDPSLYDEDEGAWQQLFRQGDVVVSGFGYYAERAKVDGITYLNTSLGKGTKYADPKVQFIESEASYLLMTFQRAKPP